VRKLTLIMWLAFLVIISMASTGQASSAFNLDTDKVELEYYFYINNIPAGIVDATFRPGTVQGLVVRKVKPLGNSFAGVREVLGQILTTSSMYCLSANKMERTSNTVTYYVNWSESFLIKAEREMNTRETDGRYIIELKSSFPPSSCIPLAGRLRVYKGDTFLYEVRYTLLESTHIVPGSIKLLDPMKRTVILALVSLITVGALYVISKSGKYRIV